MTNGVADGLGGHCFGMLGEFAANGGHRSVHSYGGDNVAVLGEVGNHPMNPISESRHHAPTGISAGKW